jgi:hypothetical protein
VISLAVTLFILVSGLLNVPVDPSGDGVLRGLGVALATGAGAGYYAFIVFRDSRILRQHQPVAPAPPPAPVPPPPLEAVLTQLVQGHLTVEQTSAILRQHPEIR